MSHAASSDTPRETPSPLLAEATPLAEATRLAAAALLLVVTEEACRQA